MLDKAYLRRRLGSLTTSLNELDAISQLTLAQYKTDFVRRHAAEKVVELIIEDAIDINRALIEAAHLQPPQTGYNTFVELEHLGILPRGLTSRLANATGLRNRLVHRYEEIDHKMVYDSLKPLLRNYRKYARLIEDYLYTV